MSGHGYSRGYRHPYIVGTYFLGGVGDNPRTLTDLAMSQFSWYIRSRPNWWELYRNQSIREQWTEGAKRKEWVVPTPSSLAKVCLSERQIAYVLDELSGYALLRDDTCNCQVSCFERIWESDSLFDPSALSLLNEAFFKLKLDKPPLSDLESNFPIIDPMLYPLVYNRTLISYPPFHTVHTQPPPQLTDIYTLSQQYALLPSDVYVSPSGSAKFLSYINDLNPDTHKAIYPLLENALTSLIPLFEHVLTDLHRNNPLPQRIPGTCRYTIWDEPDPPEYSDDEEGWVKYEREVREWTLNRPITLPDVDKSGYTGGLEKRRVRVSLKGKRLQTIVRVEEYRSTPGQPKEFASTPWHVEGMKNERIIASGFVFTSVENIENCNLQFRMAVSYPRGFSAGDIGATMRTWGLRDGDPCHAYIGSIPIREGLAIVFPNIYQHRFAQFGGAGNTSAQSHQPSQPSSLETETASSPLNSNKTSKQGRFKLLSFLLVDPEIPLGTVISTRSVPPQQKSWIRAVLLETLCFNPGRDSGEEKGSDRSRLSICLPRLPVELVDKILDVVDGLVNEEESRGNREVIEEERKNFWRSNDNYHFCIPFDVWNGPETIH
ncbi:hypothetical protein D9757_008414 [Collybiopsis confluens]|uniref:DUF4246 domain-containing protein n=1 Tax=Collybiopsis confluens TaxID=2823264 RepID=A0A8H5HHI6_9AGAR|nr:hypothetical protein D9757_008414 [Collybiopsis confluens]